MPIRAEYRWFYPIDWPQLSAVIRFKRARGRCEGCGRPHGRLVVHLGDGRWWDAEKGVWRDGKGRVVRRRVPVPPVVLEAVQSTRVYLATAHRDHDPTHNQAHQPHARPEPRASSGSAGHQRLCALADLNILVDVLYQHVPVVP